jgi:hypothetical protein
MHSPTYTASRGELVDVLEAELRDLAVVFFAGLDVLHPAVSVETGPLRLLRDRLSDTLDLLDAISRVEPE